MPGRGASVKPFKPSRANRPRHFEIVLGLVPNLFANTFWASPIPAPQDDLRPLDELPRLRSAAADPFEFSPFRVGQGKLAALAFPCQNSKMEWHGFASKWLLYR